VANRGEIAARVVRTARAMDIATVAVFSDPDADAPFVAAADEAVRLPGATPAETYLRGEAVLAAAARTGADAVHPGYGFLSENAGFARDCAAAGVTFIGPPPEAIEAMGSKVRAKELMSRAGVPVLPGVTLDADPTPAELLAAAEHTGFPVLVKAAYGGGGRGMRVVHSAADLDDAVASAQREAASAFGDGLVFLERFVTDPRHVEVQILADGQGQVVHLFERDCSIQRRYQKIVEEAPSPAVDEALRAELGAAAVAAAKAIGYVGAGTVEFVLDGTAGSGSAGSAGSASRGHFSFLEVNTRLQVEHPVTEMITGLDLVRAQLLVAEGRSLPPEVTAASVDGHAVEVRLYAEDPEADFRPDSGVLHRVRVPELPGVRVDSGVADGSVVGVHYDPLLAKVIAHAPSREEAARLLARALREAQLHGVRTNRDLLVGILTEAEFLSGRTDTGYLTRHPPAELVAAMRHPDADALHAAAAALAGAAVRRGAAPVLAGVPPGWRNVPSARQVVEYGLGDATVAVQYGVTRDGVAVAVDGHELDGVVCRRADGELVDLEVGGVRRRCRVHTVGDTSWVDSALGATTLVEIPRFADPSARTTPGSLLAPMPGTVVRVAVVAGQEVTTDTAVVVLEAMKMEHTISAPHDGVVGELDVTAGDTVGTGTVLAVVTPHSDPVEGSA